ncbi:MAG TPA: class I SAM-dependent rRNA methyltransferase, partial [Planctomycetota bacterium]|nr:class I SAM-dependent rRNA methyltransferase [Planctomycetota bacterium]
MPGSAAPTPDPGAVPPLVDLTMHPSPHPFVRRGIVRSAPKLPNGSLVTLRSPEGVILGDGFWNHASDIAVRRLTSGDVRFDAAVLEAALDRAVGLREALPGLAEQTDAWRAVHSEGDGLSGLIVDKLGEVAAVELHSAGWLLWLDALLPLLHRRLGTAHHRVTLGERTARLEGTQPRDESSPGCPPGLRIREHGARYRVDLATGHKTGFFCDQRDNRRDFAAWARGDVLDLCCYTGGFSVAAALAGRADSLTGVDLDEEALATARENLNLNQVRAQLVHADAFDWLRQVAAAGRRFDSIVLDPPKFIPGRRDEETGRGKYHDLNRLAFSVLRPGGLLLTCSCSGLLSRVEFTALVTTAARKSGRAARLLRST